MKVARVEATPLAIPLEQEFHWSGGSQLGANLVLFSVHTDDGVVGYGESICEDPRAVVSYGLLMAQHFTGHELANVEAMLRGVWTEGRWRFWPQFTQLTVSGIEVACWDALGRALGVPTSMFFGGRVRDEVDFFGFVQGDTARGAGQPRRRARGARARGALRQARPQRAGRRGVRRCDPRRDRRRPPPARRPERGVGSGRGGREDPAARAVRPRLGRAAGAGRQRQGARARAPLGRRQDRRRPGRLHDPAAPRGAPGGGGGRRRPGRPRCRRACCASASRRRSPRRTAST